MRRQAPNLLCNSSRSLVINQEERLRRDVLESYGLAVKEASHGEKIQIAPNNGTIEGSK